MTGQEQLQLVLAGDGEGTSLAGNIPEVIDLKEEDDDNDSSFVAGDFDVEDGDDDLFADNVDNWTFV